MAKINYPDKLKLAMGPTPIQHLATLSARLSIFQEVNIYVKRDDMSHGIAGGNKIRKLEFFFAEALKRKAKVVLTCGGLQSNHARATATLAKQLGLDTTLFLRGEPTAKVKGNLLVDQLLGSRIIYVNQAQYDQIHTLFKTVTDSYRAEGITAYAIPEGGSDALGVCGYVSAFEEIMAQCESIDGLPSHFDSIICAVGSGATYAGLILGRNLLGYDDGRTNCFGINVAKDSKYFEAKCTQLMIAAIQNHRWPTSFMAEDIKIIDGYVGPGYARFDRELLDFIKEVIKEDGIILDPVYAGKALYGLASQLKVNKESAEKFGKNILFIQTGNDMAFMAHQEAFTNEIS
jgi:D-cysteine desulfhydrase